MNSQLDAAKRTYSNGKTYYQCTRHQIESRSSLPDYQTDLDDAKGRKISYRATVYAFEYKAEATDTQGMLLIQDADKIGRKLYAARIQQLRNGEAFGGNDTEHSFTTEQERAEWIAKGIESRLKTLTRKAAK
jgi:hypothetical protein